MLNLGENPLGWQVSVDARIQLLSRPVGRSHVIFLAMVAVAGEACMGHRASLALAGEPFVPVETDGSPVRHVVVALALAFLALVALALALPRVVGLRWMSAGAVTNTAVVKASEFRVALARFLALLEGGMSSTRP